ncbi:MAG: YchF family ATPase [Candidatus Syntrophosphaera sp.]|nr:YchF family ATPase [Candidatus Syntrophosphaera sp.]
MKIALLGLPKSGKTTIFNAVTKSSASTDKYAPAATEPNVGVVQVPDERVIRLSELYKPKKTIYAHIEYRDYPGIFSAHAENPDNALFSDIKANEGFVLVLRAFRDEELDGLFAAGEPLRQLSAFEDEMLLSDLIVAEKRIEKIELGYKRGVKTAAIQFEEKILRQVCEQLQSGQPLRGMELHPEEEKALRGFRFFSQKPLLVLINCHEDDYHGMDDLKQQIEARGFHAEVIAGRFEEELSKLESDEAQLFMEDMGISESIRDRFTHLCYSMLGYISFFTVGEDEVRAWTIEQGDTAVIAAGKIHSDLARGFIRAECFAYDDLMAHGSEKVLREKGLFRLEGKDYSVNDGDIISVRFSV